MYICKLEYRNQDLVNKIANKNSDMSFMGVLSGNNIGEVWVNDMSNPTFVLVWSEYLGGFQFMGTSYDDINVLGFRSFIDNSIHTFLKDKEISFFEFSCDSEEMLPFVLKLLSHYEVKREWQYVYRLDHEALYNEDIPFPNGFEYLEINADFLSNTIKNYINYEKIQSEIYTSWYSIDAFLQFGKGFIAIKNNEICSFALTHFRYKDSYSIGIETYDPYKKKGLSSSLVKLLINRIVEQSGNVWWDCMESNIASQKTALKSGLVYDHKYECCWFNF